MMKFSRRAQIATVVFLAMATGAHAQSPNEQLQKMVQQLQKNPWDVAVREKTIKLAVEIKPAPAIPEEARRAFIIGEALFKRAKSLRPAYEAANSFRDASTLAPWWSNAYWNLAVAQQLAGQYVGAKESLKFYLLTNPSPADQRIAQDRIYSIDADIAITASGVSAGLAGFWQRTDYESGGKWGKDDLDSVRRPAYEIQQSGSTYSIKCMTCDNDSLGKWSLNVVSASSEAITFQSRYISSSYSGDENHACKLGNNQMDCTITDNRRKEERYTHRYAKRSVCEVVGGPGIQGYFVLCK